MRYTVITLGCLVIALCVSPAMALPIAVDGTLTDWGIRPFFDWTPNPGVVYTEANNISPVNYPGIGFVPSPGGAQGERFDAEWLGWRVSGGTLHILAVTSFAEETFWSGWNYTYRIGDLFLDVDGTGAHDYALISHNFPGHNFTPGDLYAVQSTRGIVGPERGGYGSQPDIANQTNPWVLREGDFVASGTLARASFNYGDLIGNPRENNTQLWEWGISLAHLEGLDLSKLTLHLTQECGNDVITTPPVPEPATLILVSSGLVGLSLLHRKRKK